MKFLFKIPADLNKIYESEQCPTDYWKRFLHKYITFFPYKDKYIGISLFQDKNGVVVKTFGPEINKKNLKNILDFLFWKEIDLEKFYSEFTEDKYLRKVIEVSKGLRILKDPFKEEMFLRAILTQNSSVKQIRRMQDLIMKNYGEKIVLENHVFYKFPKAEVLAKVDPKELKEKCKTGYRSEYLINVAKMITNKEIDLKKLEKLKTEDLRKKLIEIKGIGPKVADMILVYAFYRKDAFPMDTWIRKALIREYFNGKETKNEKLREFALDYFGKFSTIAHLYIFYYERKIRNKIKK